MAKEQNYWTNRKFGRRRLLGGAIAGGVGLAGLAAVGCGDDDDDGGGASSGGSPGTATQAAGTPKRGGTVNIASGLTPPHFDIHLTTLGGTTTTMSPIYSRLTTFKMQDVGPTDQVIAPDLATSWEQPDATTFVYKIRDNAFWHEGDPMNGRKLVAEDIKWSYEREMNPDTKSPHRYIFGQVAKIEAPDPATLKITLSKPDLDLPVFLSGPDAVIMGREGVEKYGDLKQHTAGSGHMMFDSYQEGAEVRLKRNPKYYLEGKPYIDGIRSLIIADASAREAAYFSGQTDLPGFVGVNEALIERIKSSGPPTSIVGPYKGTGTLYNLMLSEKWKPAADIRVREAIQRGVDRDELIKVALFGGGYIQGPVPAGYAEDAVSEDEVKKYVSHDPQKAKQLLAAAGQENLSAKMTYFVYGEANRTIAQQIKQQLAKIGVNIELQEIEYGTQTATLVSHEYEMRLTPQPGFLTPGQWVGLMHRKNGNNWSGQGDDKLDAMVEQFLIEGDAKKRREIGLQAQRYALEQYYNDDLCTELSYSIVSKRLKNWTHNSTYGSLQTKECWIE